MKPKPKIGQIIYSLNIGNAAFRRPPKLTPYVVTKVGRKYFTIRARYDKTDHTDTRFHLENWQEVTNYSASHRLFETKEEYENNLAEQTICAELYDSFLYGRNNRRLPLSTLRKLMAIIEQEDGT